MKLTQERQGEGIIFFEAILWGLFPVVTILSFSSLSPLVSLAWSTLFSALFFGIVLFVKGTWRQLTLTSALPDILRLTLVLGIVYYALIFTGLKFTSAGNVSIIALTEVLFSFLLFHVWRSNYIPKEHIFGAVLVLVGAVIVLYPNVTSFNIGDLLILVSAAIAPIGNFFQQRARKQVSGETIMFIRAIISTPFLFLLAFLFTGHDVTTSLKTTIPFLLLNGVVLLGFSKLLWIEGIHRISVTKATALASISPFITLLFAWFLL